MLAAALLAAGCADMACGVGVEKRLTLAAGPAETAASCVAQAFAASLREQRPDFHASVLPTNGSVDSLVALGDRRADLAIASGDILALAVNGEGTFVGRTVSARTLAALYTNRLYLMVPAASDVNGFSGLRDHVVGVGPAGSGMPLTVGRALEAASLERRVTLESHPWSGLLGALDRGTSGAIAWLDGLPSPAIAAAAKRVGRGVRFLNAGSVVPLLERTYGRPLYERAEIPASAYGTADSADTVGVSAVLVAREDMEEGVAFDVMRVLFRSSWALAHACGAASALSRSTAVRPQAAALHRGAARFYQQPPNPRQ